jgi:Rad3-related DNA helicase
VIKNIIEALEWVRTEYYPKMVSVRDKMEKECDDILYHAEDGDKLTHVDQKKLQEFDDLVDHLDEIHVMLHRNHDYIETQYVLVSETISFEFKRLYGAHVFNNIVKPMADKFLFMSSTVLNHKGFCDDLGIPHEEAAFLSMDSDFPVENRPVYYLPTMKMNAGWNAPELGRSRKVMADGIIKILDSYKEETGIIHTANFKIADWLVRELRDAGISHHIYHHNPDSGNKRNDTIEAFTNDSKPSLLISPSSMEGLDLKEDLGRFAIFVKVPYGNLGDAWIKRRQELSQEWYKRQALINVIQGGGRVVRSKDDWGHVFIMDSSWAYLYQSTRTMIPNWWKAAYHAIG